MSNYNTLGHNLKRGIFSFCTKLGKGLKKPVQKFILDMIYGILASKSSYLTEMARSLNEDIALDKTVERLSRNLKNMENTEELFENYINAVKPSFDKQTILILDDSDVSKPYSSKLEGLCRVHDGSTGETSIGYWFAGVSALTANHKQPIPVYSRIYSTLEKDYLSNNAETIKSLEYLSNHFHTTNIRALDRGYDAGYIFDYFIPRNESFIVRMNGKRNIIHKGNTTLISKLAWQINGTHTLKFEAKNGKKVNCNISITPVSLPKHPSKPLNLVICKGFGKEPLILLTSLSSDDPQLCVTVTKVYLMRWRIEEYYRFKKQDFGFEKFLVRSLDSIRNLDLLLSMAIGYIGILSEKIEDCIQVIHVINASKRLYGLATFTFYAISDGLKAVFSKSYVGIKSFFANVVPHPQMTPPDCS